MNHNSAQNREFTRYERLCVAASQIGDRACATLLVYPGRIRYALAASLAPDMAHDANLAYIDEDTALPNKRAMYREFEALLKNGSPFGVIMIDINKFKRVNEQYGHSRADEILAAYASKIQQQTRTDDQIFIQPSTYRTGGDEFVILAPLHARSDSIFTSDERLNRLVQRLNDDYLEIDSVMCAGEEMVAITATAYGEVVDPHIVSGNDIPAILNDISLGMLARKSP